MARFKGAHLNCAECGADFKVPPSRAATAKTCSKECADKQRGFAIERKVEIECKGCRKIFRTPRCHKDRRVFCSNVCREAHHSTIARKASKKGSQNPMWKGGQIKSGGYWAVHAPGHPHASCNYVLEHRLVMENWLLANDPGSQFLVEVNGRMVLSRAYEVHHKDEDKSNNAIDNLECLTPSEHRAVHNKIVMKALAFYRTNKGK